MRYDTIQAEQLAQEAAMFSRLHDLTQVSRSGHTVIFREPVHGRRDLWDGTGPARAQLIAAGIDPDPSAEQIAAYREWVTPRRKARSVAGARILVTAPFAASPDGRYTGETVPHNTVQLIDGFGEQLYSAAVLRHERFDPTARGRVGHKGAVVHDTDSTAIQAHVDRIRAEFPDYAGAPITDNAGAGVR